MRERVKVDVAAYVEEAGRAPALATVIVGDDPGLGDLRAQQAQGLRGGRHALGPPRARGGDAARRSCWRWSRRSAPTTRSTGSSCSCRCPTTSTPTRRRRDRPAQGRRRADAGQRRPARPRHARPGALHAGRGDGAARPRGRRAGGRRGGRRRPLEAGRRAGGAAAARAPTRPSPSATRAPATSTPICARADVLVAAVGVPRLLGAAAVKPGAVVIDVGINRLEDGLVGDVDFEAAQRGRGGDHAGARRRRADDDRDAAGQHAAGRAPAPPHAPRKGGQSSDRRLAAGVGSPHIGFRYAAKEAP